MFGVASVDTKSRDVPRPAFNFGQNPASIKTSSNAAESSSSNADKSSLFGNASTTFGNTPTPFGNSPTLFGNTSAPFSSTGFVLPCPATPSSPSVPISPKVPEEKQRPSVLKDASDAPDYGDDFIMIIVSPEDSKTTFIVHDKLARSESGFIDDHAKSELTEGAGRTMRLPDHEAEHFRIFQNFIYRRHIYSSKVGDFDKQNPEDDKEWNRLAKAYALGEHLKAHDFKDALTDAIIEKALHPGPLAWATPKSMHQIIYPHSLPTSGLRRLLVDLAATRWTMETLEAQKKSSAWADFFFDLSIAMHKLKSGTKQVPLDKCQDAGSTCACHDHDDAVFDEGAECYKVKYKI